MPHASDPGSLFFELSHARRLAILELLRDRGLRLTEIASRCRVAPPEASRHLARLVAQGMLLRNSDGTFRLTGYGALIVEGIASFEGLRSRREFLRTHDLTVLPRNFVSRLYVLTGTAVGSSFSQSLRHVEMVLGEAREFALFLSDQAMVTAEILLGSVRKSRASVRVLLPSSVLPPAHQRVTPIPSDVPLELRVLPEVRIGLAVNEKIAGVCFASSAGPIDYANGFQGTSPDFREWCEDLFEHFWKRGRVVRVW